MKTAHTGPDRRPESATADTQIQRGTSGTPERDAAETGLAPEEVDRGVALARERLRLNPDLHDSLHTLVDRALLAEYTRANELQASFDLRWKADMRAIKQWQAAGEGRELTWPDHADLCVWLMDTLTARESELAECRKRLPPREPTLLMRWEGNRAATFQVHSKHSSDVWRAMYDAALAQQSEGGGT